jgi:hypothetical protein
MDFLEQVNDIFVMLAFVLAILGCIIVTAAIIGLGFLFRSCCKYYQEQYEDYQDLQMENFTTFTLPPIIIEANPIASTNLLTSIIDPPPAYAA